MSIQSALNQIVNSVEDPAKTGFIVITVQTEPEGIRLGIHHNIGSKPLLIALLEQNLAHVKSNAYNPTRRPQDENDVRPESST